MKPFDKILVPTDFSSNAEQALGVAIELARKVGAALTILHVHNVVPFVLPEGAPAYGIIDIDRLIGELRKQLDTSKRTAEQAGAARVDTLLLEGAVYSEIVRIASERGYDMIVMGTHGRTGFAHMLLGSVAEKVVRKAPCPVITVPLRDRNHSQA